MGFTFRRNLGWLPDWPDLRDYTPEHQHIQPRIAKIASAKNLETSLPVSVDLRAWCSPIVDQGDLGSCTANAGAGLVEYFERRAFGKYIRASRLFLYKATRNLLHLTGDTGAFLRSTLGTLVLFGIPPEEYWPYRIDSFDEEPSAFCYSFAQNYQTIKYFRLDPSGTSKEQLLQQIKELLAMGIPSIFGFSVYDSIRQAESDGKIPFPLPGEKVVGGHAVMAVGYDNRIKIKNGANKAATSGAILIRNSWGPDWGVQGYGWIPYDYILGGLAEDWWSIMKNEWIDTSEFTSGENG